MRDPKHLGGKPRPWSLPRLQGAIGNRAVDRMLARSTPAPPEADVPEALEVVAQPRTWPWKQMAILCAAAGGGALGYVLEQTGAAHYTGPTLGATLGAIAAVYVSGRRED